MNTTGTDKRALLAMCLLCIALTGCNKLDRTIKEREPYIKSRQSEPIELPSGFDPPNQSSDLAIPEVPNDTTVTEIPDTTPPPITFSRQRSADERVQISEKDGLPAIEVFNQGYDFWPVISQLDITGWVLVEQQPDACRVILNYHDTDAKALKEAGFLTRLFTRDNGYADRSGRYVLSCSSDARTSYLVMSTESGLKPDPIITDDLLGEVFLKVINR